MEEWQRNHIKSNLPDLLRLTVCNELFLAQLRKDDVLGEIDVDTINGGNTRYGKARLLYEKLDTKVNGYFGLVNALNYTRQTGALKTLLLPVPIGDLKVSFLGKLSTIKSLLDVSQIESIQKWLQENITIQECIATLKNVISNHKSVLELVYDTIPKRYYLYFPRRLFRHVEISPKIFEKTCPDIFVFKNAKRSQLRKFIKLYAIESAASQILKGSITARYILLDIENDWQRICNITKAPTHLIKYEDFSESFSVEATQGVSDALRRYLKTQNACHNVNMSEDEFVERLLDENVRGVCICDSAGMGKSLLLANLASKFNLRCPDAIVVYFPLRNFKLPETPDAESPLSTILSNISASEMAKRILQELAKTNALKFELFFDGLDELGEKQQEYCTVFLQNILTNLPSARVFVSSRLVVRAKLEKSLGVIAYNIVPFNKETQVCFLSSFWEKKEPDSNTNKLKEFAEFCIEEIKDLLNKNENIITGVPLQCWLIANVYSHQAGAYADLTRKVPVTFPDSIVNTLSEVYSEFLIGQLGRSDCQFDCMTKKSPAETECDIHCQVKSFHAWQALQLIFPDIANELSLHVTNFGYLSSTDILSPGILEKSYLIKKGFEFMHRSFAEYLVAEFLYVTIFTKSESNKFSKRHSFMSFSDSVIIEQLIYDNIFVINEVGTYQIGDFYCATLREIVVAYFLNDLVKHVDNQAGDCFRRCRISPVSLRFFHTLEGCLVDDLQSLVTVFLKSAEYWCLARSIIQSKNCDPDISKTLRIQVEKIFCVAATCCSGKTIHQLLRFFQNLDSTCLKVSNNTLSEPMRIAICRAEYEVVHHILNMIPIEQMDLLYFCVEDTAELDDEEVDRRLDIAKLLLEKCSGLITEPRNYKDNLICKSPLLANRIHLKVIKFLIKHGADVRVMDDAGRTVFHQAIVYMQGDDLLSLTDFLFLTCNARDFFLDPVISKAFLSSGNFMNSLIVGRLLILIRMSQLDFKDEKAFRDSIKLDSKRMEKPIDTLRGLLSPALYQKYKNVFQDIFLAAVEKTHMDIVSLLINFDSSIIDVRDADGRTALLRAASNGELEMFRFLISRGANVFAVDNYGFTILHIAASIQYAGKRNTFHQMVSIVGKQCMKLSSSEELNNLDQVHTREGKVPVNVVELFNWKCNETLYTPLHAAIINIRNMRLDTLDLFLACGSENAMKSLLNESFININSVDRFGLTPLHHALVFKERLEFVMHLVNRGADWSLKAKKGENVIMLCAELGLVDHLKYFVELGCNINEAGGLYAETTLICAIVHRQSIQAVKHFISLGADRFGTTKTGASAMHFCAYQGLLDHTKYFIELGCDVNQPDICGNTPLVYALLAEQHIGVLKQLMDRGADWSIKNNNGDNIMHICACVGQLEHLIYFMELGCDVNAANNQGLTPLLLAVLKNRNLELVQKMVELGADWTIIVDTIGCNVTHVCARIGLFKHTKYFVGLGCDINQVDYYGSTPLKYAVSFGQHVKFIKELVALGADGSIKDNNGMNIMHTCAKEGRLELLIYFMEVGYDVNATDDKGNTSLFRAVMNKQNLDFVQKMVELGADWTKTNKVGGNITHMCARWGLLQHVRYFEELECKSNSMNSNVKVVKKHNPLLSVDLEDDTTLHYAIFSESCACFHAILCLVTEDLDEPLERHDPDCFVCYGGPKNKEAPENLHELLSWPNNRSLTPLHSAFEYLEDLSEETLDLFLSTSQKLEFQGKLLPTNVNAVDSNGNSILLYAIICKRSLELIRLLVKYGADLSARDNSGKNATLLCAGHFLLDHLKYFLELGCDVNIIDTDGDNELQCMIYVCSTDSSSVTAIVEFMKVLIDAGVDKTNKNKSEKTAYDIAVEKGHPLEVLELLQ